MKYISQTDRAEPLIQKGQELLAKIRNTDRQIELTASALATNRPLLARKKRRGETDLDLERLIEGQEKQLSSCRECLAKFKAEYANLSDQVAVINSGPMLAPA